MPRTVKSDSRARGTGSNQTPHTRLSRLTPTPRVTRSSSRVTVSPTSTGAHAASHTPRPPTRRSKRRIRKRGPGGSLATHKSDAGTSSSSSTHERGAGANTNSKPRTTKKPRLEDFVTDSEDNEGYEGIHPEASAEDDGLGLEQAHEMDVSESQDTPSQPSYLNNDSLMQDVGQLKAPSTLTHQTDEYSPPSTQDETRRRTRHYGLLGERAASPFDEDVWKDWILTPLELRHSQAPREPEYDGFPGPGPLPPIPCVVRFDIVMRYPAKSLCMIGCARSDVSNGWVVTHSKSLIIDIDEAREFVDTIRYRADVTELLGEGREDALRLEYHYQTWFEDTIFEHPWLLDLQKRYRSTYSLKSTLSEYEDGEILPRGTLTRNGSWNHRVQGELTEKAGFIRRMELHERYKLENEDAEGKAVGKEVGKDGGKEEVGERADEEKHGNDDERHNHLLPEGWRNLAQLPGNQPPHSSSHDTRPTFRAR
ncbi:hypothetical protein PLEOSDRAFT_164008 [Pleurotus ostreatus PC15]|uniref:Uncharacterized protein n=1 Tax=Pleurotus ostreatus (strain PC15) TaxID=1137138 RepID=A0A067P1N6_PLEO1|nr:hypothetical protein PLEOSDRAFT_164008 [Pleurotus ostreatus PC15]